MFGWLRKLTGGARRPAPPPFPVPQGPLSEYELRAVLARPCAPLVFAKPANIDPFETMFGAVRLERKGEVWPSCEGAPMWPLCQINLKAAPIVPRAVKDLALITLFIRGTQGFPATRLIDTQNPDPSATWALRSYRTLEGLTIPRPPAHGSPLFPRLGEWAVAQPDYANHDMAGYVIDTGVHDVYAYEWCQTLARTKLGGWPATVQSEPWWDYQPTGDTWDFVLQIENEAKAGWYGWGDGAAYIARSRERPHVWAMDVQFT